MQQLQKHKTDNERLLVVSVAAYPGCDRSPAHIECDQTVTIMGARKLLKTIWAQTCFRFRK